MGHPDQGQQIHPLFPPGISEHGSGATETHCRYGRDAGSWRDAASAEAEARARRIEWISDGNEACESPGEVEDLRNAP